MKIFDKVKENLPGVLANYPYSAIVLVGLGFGLGWLLT